MPTNYALRKTYGITTQYYSGLLRDQGRRCAICDEPFSDKNKPQVDHNHKTGNVRGLLCGKCNRLLAKIKDDYEWAESAAYYLRGDFEYRKPPRNYDGFD